MVWEIKTEWKQKGKKDKGEMRKFMVQRERANEGIEGGEKERCRVESMRGREKVREQRGQGHQ